ncbi:MAG: glycerol-3-phosphate 1-O-acyltransferase PlsY [Lachnospiraceae bacterium]|nr:glycerol-3-phosphate 1-O-acyltransferase PlsY [Lachnospiraceae bacterium]
MIYIVLLIVIGYILGCCQTGFFIGKRNKIDIRQYGSGNSGATNTLRVLGKKAAFLTFLGDALKGVFTVLIARFLISPHVDMNMVVVMLIGGLASILGHDYPFHMKFKGGKGVSTTGGVLFAIDPRMALICVSIVIIITYVTRYVSLASITMMIAIPFILWGFYGMEPQIIGMGVIIGLLSIWRHRANVGRLLNGTESKLGQQVER